MHEFQNAGVLLTFRSLYLMYMLFNSTVQFYILYNRTISHKNRSIWRKYSHCSRTESIFIRNPSSRTELLDNNAVQGPRFYSIASDTIFYTLLVINTNIYTSTHSQLKKNKMKEYSVSIISALKKTLCKF